MPVGEAAPWSEGVGAGIGATGNAVTRIQSRTDTESRWSGRDRTRIIVSYKAKDPLLNKRVDHWG